MELVVVVQALFIFLPVEQHHLLESVRLLQLVPSVPYFCLQLSHLYLVLAGELDDLAFEVLYDFALVGVHVGLLQQLLLCLFGGPSQPKYVFPALPAQLFKVCFVGLHLIFQLLHLTPIINQIFIERGVLQFQELQGLDDPVLLAVLDRYEPIVHVVLDNRHETLLVLLVQR